MESLFVPYVGRPRRFRTPEQLEKAFVAYLEDRKARTLVQKETEEGVAGENPFTKTKKKSWAYPVSIEDFCVYCGTCRCWFNELPAEFSEVRTRISNFLYNHQINGATVGEYNPVIVARRLGLEEKKRIEGIEAMTIQVNSKEEKENLEKIAELGV